MINATKSDLGRKGLISSHSLLSIMKGSPGWNLEAGTEAKKECCLLTYFQSLFGLFSYTTQDHQHRGGTAHSGLHHPMSVINQDYAPKDWPKGHSNEGNSSTDAPICLFVLPMSQDPQAKPLPISGTKHTGVY